MEWNINLRRGFLVPAIAVLALFASLLTPMQSAFAAGAPTVSGVSPNRGSTLGGTSITITGTGFSGTITVTVGGASATSPLVVNTTTATAITPAGTTGAKDVVLTRTSDSKSGTGTGLFTYGYSVTYNANNATSGTVPVDSTIYNALQSVTVLGNTGTLARTNYVFANWNTAANGSGTSYSGGNTFTIADNTTLYAQWTPTYTVIYNGNSNTGGTVPTDASSPYISGGTVTVLGNTGSLVKTGSTFANWNTAANGSGTSYAPTNTFAIAANTVLYAQWRASITYNENGATGGSVPVDASSPYLTGSTVTVLGNTGSLTKTSFNFASWNTAANGSGSTYTVGNTFALSADTVLYAQWSAITYTVTYNGNGNTGGNPPSDGSSPYTSGALVTVLGNTGSLVKTGSSFSGWNTAANGSGTSYAPSATFNIGANTTLYAQWASTFTVTYNGNGKTGGSSPVDGNNYLNGATVTVLGNSGSLVKTGNTFSNWNSAADGSGIQYAPNDTFIINSNTILYAQWRAAVTYNANGATAGTAPNDASSPYLDGATVTVLGNTGSLVKTDNTFAGWNTAANGSGTTYAPGNTFVVAVDTALYALWSPVTYTVTYSGNTNTGGTVPVDVSSPYATGSLVTVLGNTGSLIKTGYNFSHWNTAANGSGTTYAPSATFNINANTILYAQWAVTYTVIYDEDGATGGTVPVDGSSPYLSGSLVTVLGNIGSLVKTGNTFIKWNTQFNGSGTDYLPGATFTIVSNVILYPQWTNTLTYNANGATGGTVPVDGNSPYLNGATVTVLGNTGSLVKTGNTFSNWNTAANGSGTTYAAGNTFAISIDTVLYAQWRASVTYNGNGNTGGIVPTDASSPYLDGATVTVLGNTGSLVKPGYVFSHWNTAANGLGTSYSPTNTFTASVDIVLYAQWTTTYTLTYYPNGATGGSVPVDASSPYAASSTVTVLGNTGALVRTGNTFANWNTAADGSGTPYSSGNTFTINASTILYAQWRASVTYSGNGNTGGTAPTDASSPYLNGATVTVLGNTGSLVRTGYAFVRWNTAANGSGIYFLPTDTFSVTVDTVLYAQWTVTYTLSYDGNGSTGGTAPVDASSPYINGTNVTVLGNTGSLVKTGYTFTNWNTAANGSGFAHSPSDVFSIGANTVLYAQWTPIGTFSVTYNGNGSTGGNVPVDSSSPYIDGSTVTVLGNTGSLVKTGYTFANWNTAANGSGATYSAGNTFVIAADTVLYAQWTPVTTWTLTYNGNGNTGGTAPVDASSPYVNNATVTVLGNTGSLVKTGFTFLRWNTAANGSGTNYSATNTFTISANTTLYAQWVITYTITYDADGATGGTVPVDPSSPYATDATVTVLGNTGTLTRTGNTFSGWDTTYNGTGTAYAPGSTFTITSNIILYAQWHASVTYNGNGNTGGVVPVDASSPYENGTTVTVLGNTGSLVEAGHTFANWNTVANGSGTPYSSGNTFLIVADTVLYAQWTLIGTHTMTYNGNGATSGSVPVDPSSPYADGATVTVLGNTGALAQIGYHFSHWNTAANGSGTTYLPTDTFTINANTILYAQWITTYNVIYDEDGATGGTVPVDASNPYSNGASVTILSNTGSLSRTGGTFLGWNTVEDGSGTFYAPGAVITIGATLVLYVQWTSTVAYNANGATGGTVPVDSSSPYVLGSTVTVLGNTGSLAKSGSTFSHWNTAANGTGVSYSASNTFPISINTVLYAQWTATVTYNGNGETSGSVPVDSSSPYALGSTVTVRANTGSLIKTGSTFVNWNTAADGSGTSYSPGATFTIAANTVLYARWTLTHTVIYRGGGSTGGSVPVDGLSPYAVGATVTVLGNTGSLVRSGTTFSGWNTAIDGSGASYTAGDTFIVTSDTLIFAQWRSTLTYDANGATGGSVPVDPSSPYLTPYINDPTVTVLGNIGSLVKQDEGGAHYFPFAGWNTAANGSGISYSPGGTFVIAANTILYAQWGALLFTVTYNGNGSNSGTVPVDAASPYPDDATVTVKSNSGVLAKIGYVFSHWNTAANGSGTSYAPGATFIAEAETVLYAQWTAAYTLLYDEDGATGGTAPVDASSPYLSGATVTVLANTGALVRTGNTFAGWNTVEAGSGTSYAPGATFTISANTTLFAQWTVAVTYNSDGATGGTVPVDASSPYSNPFGGQAIVTVMGNSGSLVRTGYTFVHWGTGANNSGEHYRPGDQFVVQQNTILYAHWELTGTHNVVYNDNGSTGGTVPMDSANPYATGSTVTVLGNTGSLVKSGSIFEGWNTSADGSGTSYKPSNQFVVNAATILYAEWESNVFNVTYNGNGSTSGTVPVDLNNPYDSGDLVTILSNSGALAKTGYAFAGWNTASDGSGTTYDASGNDEFLIATDTTFYAIWIQNHTVTFDSNTGVGSMSPQSSDVPIVLTANAFTKNGYSFSGWNTAANGNGVNYRDGATYSFASSVRLFAQWTSTTQPYSPPAVTSPVATVELPVSESIDTDATSETIVEASLEMSNGTHAEVSVSIPPGASSYSSMTLSIAPASTVGGVSTGLVAIKVTAVDSSGVAITHFDKPLSVNIGRISPSAIPMFSEDGILWIPIPLLSGTILPDDMQEGYYVASDGHIVILTRHLTYFGTKKTQRVLVATPRTTTIEAGKYTRVIATGGSGAGVRGFLTTTPDVCKISTSGLLMGLAAGECTFRATRSGDSTYAAIHSAANNVTIYKAPQRKLWISVKAFSIKVGQKANLAVHGGSGIGVLTYKTSSSTVCTVSGEGVVTGLSEGSCLLSVTKASDKQYLAYVSQSLSINVIKSDVVKK